jgi:hypothetical protein
MIMRSSLVLAAASALALGACGSAPPPVKPPPPPPPPPVAAGAIGSCVATTESDEPAELAGCVLRDTAGELRVAPALLATLYFEEDLGLAPLLRVDLDAEAGYRGPVARDLAGWVNRDGLLRVVPSIDNGPDYVSSGLVRYVAADGKVGFVDQTLAIVVPARFDWAEPFEGDAARVCTGCTAAPDGEHAAVTGGTWSTIDRAGAAVTRP